MSSHFMWRHNEQKLQGTYTADTKSVIALLLGIIIAINEQKDMTCNAEIQLAKLTLEFFLNALLIWQTSVCDG